MRLEDAKKKKNASQKSPPQQSITAKKSEAEPQNFLFEKEYIPGKGMKNGGYGGLLVGKHNIKQQKPFDMEAEQARTQKWLQEF